MKKFSAIGMNIFGGGFTLGVLQSGHFNINGQLEECDAGAKTFDLNKRYFNGIPRPLKYEEWDTFARPEFIYANPPCAPWSAANTRIGMNASIRHADPRLAMTDRTMRTALAMRPRVFALETVARGYTTGRSYYDKYAEQWLKAGYGVTYYLTDALLLGVPSTRQRFHFIAHRDELYVPDKPEDLKNFMPRTVSSAIGDIMDHFGHLPHHIPRRISPEAHELCRVVGEGRQLNGTGSKNKDDLEMSLIACTWKPSFLNKKLVWDAPAFTIVNLEQHIHPRRPRFLTWRESLRLAGYPDDFLVHQPQGATQAVLPMVGKHCAELAFESLESGKKAQNELRFVDHREFAKPYRPGTVRGILEEEAL